MEGSPGAEDNTEGSDSDSPATTSPPSTMEGRFVIIEVITECSRKFIHSNEALFSGMCAIVNESYPEPNCIKDGNSDYQAQKSVIWRSQMGNVGKASG